MPKRAKSYHSWLIKKLSDQKEAERYLKVAAADSPEMFLKALRNVAEARRISKVAEDTGLNRESLYKALSEDGNPRLSTLDSVLDALGMYLTVNLKQSGVVTPSGTTRRGERMSDKLRTLIEELREQAHQIESPFYRKTGKHSEAKAFMEIAEKIEAALASQPEAQPFAYACPANCGCIWRDNHDGTMSLFGKRSQSCEVCEPLPLDKLIPLYRSALSRPAQEQPQLPSKMRWEFIGYAIRIAERYHPLQGVPVNQILGAIWDEWIEPHFGTVRGETSYCLGNCVPDTQEHK